MNRQHPAPMHPTPIALLALALLASGCGPGDIASEQPAGPVPNGVTISAVTGTPTSATTLVISGYNFGPKATAKPKYWADFANDTEPSNLGVNTAWSYRSISAERVSATVGSRTGAFLRDDVSTNEGAKGVAIFGFDLTKRAYLSFKRYYAYDITTNQGSVGFNNKALRIWPDVLTGALPYGNNVFWGWQGSEGLNSFRSTNENTQTSFAQGTVRASGTRGIWKFGQWQNEQVIYQASGIDVADGIFSWYRDGDNIMNNWVNDSTGGDPIPGERRWVFRTAERPNYHSKIFFDQVSNGTRTDAGALYVYYSNIYIDDTWSRVMLSSAATWSGALDVEVQIPSAWTDRSISVTVNLGDLNPSGPLYLYVVDQDGNVNTNGYRLR